MAIDLEKGFSKLIQTVILEEAGYHQDYERVVKLAELYENLITGEHPEQLLIQFNPREDDEQFNQRVRLTQLLTPSVCEKIMQPFYKVSRIDNVKKAVLFKGKNDKTIESKISEIESAIEAYYGDESLDDFMETEYVELVFTDPNSFIVTEFNDFNHDSERAKPFPYLVTSKEAVNYSYDNNVLQFLIIRKPIKFKSTDDKNKIIVCDGSKYRLYLDDNLILLTEVDPKLGGTDYSEIDLAIETPKRIKIGKKVFTLDLKEHLAGQVPAIRVGYKRDISTKGRTMISPIHKAVPRMMKSVKAVSELDLTGTLHTFPQKFQYAQACLGKTGEVCRDGKNSKGENCSVCGGSGLAVHKSSADAVILPMPRDEKDMLDLDKLMVYKNPPIDLIKWQDEYVEKLERKCLTDVFVSESINQITKTQTATEKELDMESIYDTLFPFGKRFSAVYIKQGRLIATFIDNGDAIIIHAFPKDLKLKTEKMLMEDLKAAKEAGIPPFLKIEIENDIASKVYADNPEKLRIYRVNQQHIPFSGKTAEEITLSINLGLTTNFDKILYANFDSIMSEIDQEQISKQVNFYELPFEQRAKLIDEKVVKYTETINGEKSTATQF